MATPISPAQVLKYVHARDRAPGPMREVTFFILRNYTVEYGLPYVKYHAYQKELRARIELSDFNAFESTILDTGSELYSVKPDIVLLTLRVESFLAKGEVDDLNVSSVYERMAGLLDTLRSRTSAHVIVSGFARPYYLSPSQHFDQGTAPIGVKLMELNVRLARKCADIGRASFVPLEGLVAPDQVYDPRFLYMSSAPYSTVLLDRLGAVCAEVAHASVTAPKKAVVLDGDNTLWGGVIGEDGLDGIALDPDRYPGSAFYDFQKQLLALKRQGVLLAMASKNEEADVFEVVESHPHSLLRRSDFSEMRVNWMNKPENIQSIARSLNLGLDSIVFIDDSSTECEAVRALLPEVTVLQVPDEAYEIPGLLRAYQGFLRLALTEEDLERSRMMSESQSRVQAEGQFGSFQEFLEHLQVTVCIEPLRERDVARLSQLTQKTNQFNLRTKRYPEFEIARMLNDPHYRLYVLRARDRFGDYGLVGAAIVHLLSSTQAFIDTLLMSCRALGKGIEDCLVQFVLKALSQSGIQAVEAEFIPTRKNQQVRSFYGRHGFEAVGGQEQEGVRYVQQLEGADKVEYPRHIRVVPPPAHGSVE